MPVLVASRQLPIYAYMIVKYTLRWQFYRINAWLCHDPHYDKLHEVVNPARDQKLEEVALRHQIDPVKFKRNGYRLRRVWPLLP